VQLSLAWRAGSHNSHRKDTSRARWVASFPVTAPFAICRPFRILAGASDGRRSASALRTYTFNYHPATVSERPQASSCCAGPSGSRPLGPPRGSPPSLIAVPQQSTFAHAISNCSDGSLISTPSLVGAPLAPVGVPPSPRGMRGHRLRHVAGLPGRLSPLLFRNIGCQADSWSCVPPCCPPGCLHTHTFPASRGAAQPSYRLCCGGGCGNSRLPCLRRKLPRRCLGMVSAERRPGPECARSASRPCKMGLPGPQLRRRGL